MSQPMFPSIADTILKMMSRAEKRGAKQSQDVCFDVVLFLGSKLQTRYTVGVLRDISEEIHGRLQSITIPPRQ